MTKYNAKNEIIKKRYLKEMEDADGYKPKTIDATRNAINCYEVFTKFECLAKSNPEKFLEFKKYLIESKKNRHGKQSSLSHIEHTLTPLKKFFKWLAQQNGYRSRKKAFDVRYLSLKMEDRRKIRSVPKIKEYYEIDEVNRALNFNPKNDVEMRDRAILAILACTAIRHEALITLKVGHVDIKREAIFQDPRTMKTKNDKYINTKILDLGSGLKEIVVNWVKYLKEELNFNNNDPLFPKEELTHNEYMEFVGGVKISKNHIQSHGVIPKVVNRVMGKVGLKYINPHSFRNMQIDYVLKNCGIQEAAALSLNYGHESLAITIGNYYKPTPEQQFDILGKIGKEKEENVALSDKELIDFVRKQMKKEKKA